MSLMNDMLGDILKKAIPPEVMALLTEENIGKLKGDIETFVSELRTGIVNIQLQNDKILSLLEGQTNERLNHSGSTAGSGTIDTGGNAPN